MLTSNYDSITIKIAKKLNFLACAGHIFTKALHSSMMRAVLVHADHGLKDCGYRELGIF